MQRTMLAVAVLALTFAACGGGGAGSTPEATFEAMKSATIAMDGGAIFDLMAPAAQEEIAKDLEEMKKSPMKEMMLKPMGISADELDSMTAREYFATMTKSMSGGDEDITKEAKASKIVDTKIEGDKATLTIDAGGKQDKREMIRIDGKWYVIL